MNASTDQAVLEVLQSGLGATVQDRGRIGWRRVGVPPSGFMDDHAAGWANRLLDNPPNAPVLELLLQGAKFRALKDVWIAVTGAEAGSDIPAWRAVHLNEGDIVEFPRNISGVWTYLAVEGGFSSERILGSASVYMRGKLGQSLARGQRLSHSTATAFKLPDRIVGRSVDWSERRNYDDPPPIRVWRGPQWELFGDAAREQFLEQDWTVTSQSDRVGYRLQGEPLRPPVEQIVSEPVLVGSIQVPSSGQPIVTMRDGPTIGGYPKIGIVDPQDVAWLTQCRPGTEVRFRIAE